MKNSILLSVLNALVPKILELTPAPVVKQAIDKALDAVEDAVANSANKIDDATILPVCRTLRAALGVPDEDEAR